MKLKVFTMEKCILRFLWWQHKGKMGVKCCWDTRHVSGCNNQWCRNTRVVHWWCYSAVMFHLTGWWLGGNLLCSIFSSIICLSTAQKTNSLCSILCPYNYCNYVTIILPIMLASIIIMLSVTHYAQNYVVQFPQQNKRWQFLCCYVDNTFGRSKSSVRKRH